MSRAEGRWGNTPNQEKQLEDHPDYGVNLSTARNFMAKVLKSLFQGMSIAFTDENRVLMISYRPPYDAPMGNYAAPVNLHQSKYNFETEMSSVFNAYYKMAREANERYRPEPRQGPLFDL